MKWRNQFNIKCQHNFVHVYEWVSLTMVYQQVEENEAVVQYLLDNRPQFRLVPTGLDIGEPGVVHNKLQM